MICVNYLRTKAIHMSLVSLILKMLGKTSKERAGCKEMIICNKEECVYYEYKYTIDQD